MIGHLLRSNIQYVTVATANLDYEDSSSVNLPQVMLINDQNRVIESALDGVSEGAGQ